MRPDTPYYPIPGSQPEGTFGAILGMLLKTRVKLNLDSQERFNDEDVNTYVGGLLVSYIDPRYLAAVAPVLSKHDLDVHEAVVRAQDRVQTYWIYKVNADDLLVTLGIFHRLWREARGEVDRMRQYYSCASECQRRIYGRSTAVAEIQEKIARESERYLTILSEVRSHYLRFVSQLGTQEMREFNQRLERFQQELPLRLKQDEMLDAYSACVREPQSQELRHRLAELLEELKRLYPNFRPDQILSRLPSR